MALAIPHIVRVAFRLRKALARLRPRAIWVDQEKTLFIAWLAAPRDLPIAVYRAGELSRILPYCRLAWNRSDIALGVSESCLTYLRTTRYAHANFRVVYYGIDVDRVLEDAKSQPEGLPSCSAGGLRVVFPAQLGGPAKGHESGIRAFAKFIEAGRDAHLLLAGCVPPEVSTGFCNRMRKLTCDLNVQEHVHFLGYRHDILSVIRDSDIVLLPSHSEGMPRSLMEGMALAKPVIATRVGGIPELVRDGTDGILVNPGDIEALVKALNVLSDLDVRKQMGNSGQQRIRQSFSVSRQAKEFLSTMDALVERRRLGAADRWKTAVDKSLHPVDQKDEYKS
jgi:glycosyltransferase involved in cell wall biosynthesis